MSVKSNQEYSAKEIEQRREAALERMLATPPNPHAAKGKKKPSPQKYKAKKKIT